MDNFKDTLPLVTTLLITLGVFRLISYYDPFGIDITAYLEVSEVLLILFSYFTKIFLYFAGIYCFILLIAKILDVSFINVKKILGLISIAMMVLSASISAFIGNVEISNAMYDIALILLAIIFIQEYQSNDIVDKQLLIFLSIALFVGLLSSVKIGGRSEAEKIMSDVASYDVRMKFDSTVVTTSNSYFYIGRTKNYLFFYNKKSKFADIVATSSIKELAIRKHKFADCK